MMKPIVKYIDRVPTVMAKLTVDQMVWMFYGERKTNEEIAKAAGISVEYLDEIQNMKIWDKYHRKYDKSMGYPISY